MVGFNKVPPQRIKNSSHILPNPLQHSTKACAGQLCGTASVPPIILEAGFGGIKNLRPHS